MHRTNELEFDRPVGLTDRTAHILAAGDGGPSPFTIVISKTAIEPGDSLPAMVARIRDELSRALDDFRLIREADGTVAGQPAAIIQFTWLQSDVQLYQKQAAFIADLADGRLLMQIAATATAEAGHEDAAGFDAMLASMRLRQPPA